MHEGAALTVDLALLAETEAYIEPKTPVMVLGTLERDVGGGTVLRAILFLRVPELDLHAWALSARQLARR